jgi:hypothetical protein
MPGPAGNCGAPLASSLPRRRTTDQPATPRASALRTEESRRAFRALPASYRQAPSGGSGGGRVGARGGDDGVVERTSDWDELRDEIDRGQEPCEREPEPRGLLLLGTRASPRSPRNRTTRFGRSAVISRARDLRPSRTRTRIATSQTPTRTPTATIRGRSILDARNDRTWVAGDAVPQHDRGETVVETSGLEPPTPCLQSRCSTS